MSDDDIREAAVEAIPLGRCEWHGTDRSRSGNCDTCYALDAERLHDARAVIAAVRPLIEADLRERLAAAIEAAGHPDGYHRVGMSREEAGIYCADCAVTSRSARIVRERP